MRVSRQETGNKGIRMGLIHRRHLSLGGDAEDAGSHRVVVEAGVEEEMKHGIHQKEDLLLLLLHERPPLSFDELTTHAITS
jgi:hypothetical protein